MNASTIATTARSFGFTKVNPIDSGFNAGGVFVWLWTRGARSHSSDDAYLFFRDGKVHGPRPDCQSMWSDRECADIEAVRAELLAAKSHRLTSHVR